MKKAKATEQDGKGEKHWLFKKGDCPNPRGRPLGARIRLSDAFLKDFLADWQEHGVATIQTFRRERPHEYVKLVATIIPKQFNVKVNDLDEFTDEQLRQQLASLLAAIAGGDDAGTGTGEEGAAKPLIELQAIR